MSKALCYKGALTTGHGNHVPTTITSGSNNVFVNGIPAVKKGDSAAIHSPDDKPCPASDMVVSSGSSSVYINGQPAARVSDDLKCGDCIAEGSQNVFIG